VKIIHFADLHLGVENYGRTDPATGLSSRLLDFLSALDKLVDYAINNKIDLVLFCGDAYKSRDPSQTQQRELAKRLSRLSAAGIPVFLLVGNHDLPNAVGRATTTEIFDTLSVKNIYVSNKPGIYKIKTPGGSIQIASLPWLRRSAVLAFMNKQGIKSPGFEEINRQMEKMLTDIISDHASSINPEIPAILAAHIWVSGASLGSERYITIGQEHTLLLSNVADPAFDYVALGHIHRHQVLSEKPPVVYAGSLERLDFGEEKDDKGFYVIDIAIDDKTGERKVSFNFHRLKGRRFLTIIVDIDHGNPLPMATILKEIEDNKTAIKDAIVRLQVNLTAESEGFLSDSEINNALKEAHYFTVTKNIDREVRLRLGNRSAEEITPSKALEEYLKQQDFSKEYGSKLLEYGSRLLQEVHKDNA